MLKKIVAALLLCWWLTCCADVSCAALAETVSFARITEDDVYLFASESDDQRLFVLEKSYYLQIQAETDRMYFVYIMQNEEDFPLISGYVYKSQVSDCLSAPVAPLYPTEKIAVLGGSAPLRQSPTPSALPVITAVNTQKLSYYGSIVNYGTTWYYVYYGGKFGYVDAETVSAPQISPHPTPLPSRPAVTTPSETEPPTTETPTEPTPTSEILLIVFVVVLAVGVTLALFLPGNLKKKNAVFDQDI